MKQRRGLSSIIGMLFFVIILVSAISYFTYSIRMVDKVNDEVIVKGIESVDKIKEDFEIVSASIDNGKFNITIQNTGSLPINFKRLWVNNVTDNTWPLQNFTVNKVASPGQVLNNIGKDLNLYALESQAYSMKLITQRGNSEGISINSVSQGPVDLKFFALPSTVSDKFHTTLLLIVTNNMTKNNMLLNLKPEIVNIQKTATAQETLVSPVTPNEHESLAKGDTAYFSWTYQISGVEGDSVTFTASVENSYPGNEASATVTVNKVLLADKSGTSLEALGLGKNSLDDSVLIFHAETDQTPNGAYQMFSGASDGGVDGTLLQLESTTPSFFTKNGTDDITVPAGLWTASLQLQSEAMPDSLMDDNDKNMIFHFEANTDPEDSTGNTNGHNLGSGSERPTHESTGGPHGSGAFRFDDNDYIKLNKDPDNDIKKAPDTTSLWFKADDGVSDTQYLYHAKKTNGDEYYKIIIDTNDNVVFEYLTKDNLTPAKCESSGFDYENDKWQHVVAVRPTDNTCKLYINATDVDLTPQNGNTNDDDVRVDEIFVGAEDDNPGDGFNGIIDDVLHWDNYALTSVEVSDLFNTNYGTGAHKFDIWLDQTDIDGILVQNIYNSLQVNFPFQDSKGLGDNDDNGYSVFNFTFNMPQVNVTAGQRLNFSMNFIDSTSTWEALDLDMKIDDETLSPYASFLQIQPPDNAFRSYFIYDNDFDLEVWITNTGANGIYFIQQGTRISLNGTNGAYAAMIKSVNGTNPLFDMSYDRDSIYIPVGSKAQIWFHPPTDHPSVTPIVGTRIPPGTYSATTWLEGYDDQGESFARSVKLGSVLVVD